MTKELCPKCNQGFSTTCSPNSEEGYWLSDVAKEKLDFEISVNPNINIFEWFMDNCPRVIRCPYCKEFSLSWEPEQVEELDR